MHPWKTIVVVPRLHFLDHGLHVAVGAHLTRALIIIEDIIYIFRGETKHLIELWLGRDVPPYVEATCHIIERHWTHTCDENAFESALELLEYVAVEAFSVGHRPINLLTLLIEHGIGKVVILVDDEIKRIILHLSFILYDSQFSSCVLSRIDILLNHVRIILIVITHEAIQLHAQVEVELLLQVVDIAPTIEKSR